MIDTLPHKEENQCMNTNRKIIALVALSMAGLLFSGYLSAVKFFTMACALNEPCPRFLGYPACYFGFGMYIALTILAVLLINNAIRRRVGLASMIAVSFLGILFSGSFTLQELPKLFSQGLGAYALGLPTCAWGLVFYALIFIIASMSYRQTMTE